MQSLVRLIRFCVGLGALGVATLSILAAFGFASPALDVLNHLQVLLFIGTLLGLLVAPAIMHGPLWRRFLLAFTATGFLMSAINVVPETVAAYTPRPPVPSGAHVIRMMTHNLFGMNYDMQRVMDVAHAANPDIIALQEYFPEQRERLHDLLLPEYPFFIVCAGGKRANNAIYSRLPFSIGADGRCSEDPGLGNWITRIVAQFNLADGTAFSVMTTHLDWPVPVWRQSSELDDLTKDVTATTGPLVLVGDMNSTPWSYALRGFALSSGLVRQTHAVLTYPLRFFIEGRWRNTPPFLALDHVMTRDLTVHELHTLPATGSDHLPVFFTFTVGPPAPESADANPA